MDRHIYLDYAATSAVRPPEVVQAVADFLSTIGATPGRGTHRLALSAGRIAFRCRRALAELLSIPGDPGRIAFQFGATHALNTALFGTLRPGDTVVRTALDHNAVRRPIAALRDRGVQEVVLSGTSDGGIDLDEAERAIAGTAGMRSVRFPRRPARLLVLPHASNVLGTLTPVAELAEIARACGTLVLVDAAQSAGHVPVAVERMGADMIALTGHKGLLGPQGTGGLWVREGVEVEPLLFGGTSSGSWEEDMPEAFPDHLEAGSQNGPGLAGLLAGTEWLLRHGVASVHQRTRRLADQLRERLKAIAGVKIHSPADPRGTGIVTITVDGWDSGELARRLDVEHGILTRAGLHCAPETHVLLGTERGGALRISFGWASEDDHAQRAADALVALCGNGSAPAEVHPSRLEAE
jgi:cysteine desulfurase / selenocysteine lyase